MSVSIKHLLTASLGLIALAVWSRAAYGDAPVGRYRMSSQVVTDDLTGLDWQRTVDPRTFKRNEASAYCQSLTLAGGGWRLPALKEMLTLVDISDLPAIDERAFPDTPSSAFWTVSAYRGTPDVGWVVYFDTGRSGTFGLGFANRVRCVR